MPESPKLPAKAESLSLAEMMRIMDVATEMRTQRETVEKQFAIDETKRILKEKLLKTTSITGERVTEAEVDAAIESYFRTLYTFEEPKGSFAVSLARLYVRRGHMAMLLVLATLLVATGWLTMHIARTQFSQTARITRKANRVETALKSDLLKARNLARETSVKEDLDRWEAEAAVAREQLDVQTLNAIDRRITELTSRLNEEYEVHISADPQQKSGFSRYPKGEQEHKAYYLIVSAQNEKGQLVRRTIRDAEVVKSFSVDRWAEQVPKEVFDRIAADKKADGILNETLFSQKQRGYRDEEVRILDADGKPLSRMAQITEW